MKAAILYCDSHEHRKWTQRDWVYSTMHFINLHSSDRYDN